MLHTDYINNAKLITLILVVVSLIGCGGGRSATTSTASSQDVPSTQAEPTQAGPAPALPNGIGSAVLSWLPPTTYADGSTFSDLAGHNVYMNDGNGFKKVATISSGVTTYVVENLSPGVYDFAVTAFDSMGIESYFSNSANILISS